MPAGVLSRHTTRAQTHGRPSLGSSGVRPGVFARLSHPRHYCRGIGSSSAMMARGAWLGAGGAAADRSEIQCDSRAAGSQAAGTDRSDSAWPRMSSWLQGRQQLTVTTGCGCWHQPRVFYLPSVQCAGALLGPCVAAAASAPPCCGAAATWQCGRRCRPLTLAGLGTPPRGSAT
jgi:hypothetical protein